ncbi:unannotated protein [freshwater metagenome]|uniref:Unannotated protein n=1 Tax=freshwater metagenome TaxID=449393 RepID=A0A6J7DC45_9ZZZZ|nr:hypothetical protein [Actinomycetota bacterium]
MAVLGWLGTVLIVQHLTERAWGQLSFVLGLLGIVGLISDFRLGRVVLAEVIDADENVGEIVGAYIGLRTTIGLFAYAVAMAWVTIGSYPSNVVVVTAVAGLNLVILSAGWGIGLLFTARLWMRSVAIALFAGQVVQLALTVAIVFGGVSSPIAFASATVLNSIVFVVLLLFASRNVATLSVRVDLHRWGLWLSEAAPLALGSALDTIYFRIDIVMLSILGTFRAVGSYSVAYKFSDLLGAVPGSVIAPAAALLIGHWAKENHGAFHKTVRQAYLLLIVAAVGAGVGFFLVADHLVPLLYTSRYSSSAYAARLLVIGQTVHFFTALWLIILIAVGKRLLYPLVMLIGVAINVGLNLILIPRYSFNGAGWATIVTEIVVCSALGIGALRVNGVRPLPLMATAKTLFAALVMVGIWLATERFMPWWVAVSIASLGFFLVLHFLQIDGPGGLRALAREAHMADQQTDIDPSQLDPGRS